VVRTAENTHLRHREWFHFRRDFLAGEGKSAIERRGFGNRTMPRRRFLRYKSWRG